LGFLFYCQKVSHKKEILNCFGGIIMSKICNAVLGILFLTLCFTVSGCSERQPQLPEAVNTTGLAPQSLFSTQEAVNDVNSIPEKFIEAFRKTLLSKTDTTSN
jgi:hypothetical protein